MNIFFYGASKIVTGSSFLVETSDYRLLIDCGMFQGSKVIKELNYGDFPYDPKTIDSVILTHAHIDHSGLLPKLITNGYNGPIYATPETIELCSIMLPDSGYIQEMEIERKNRKRTRAGLPLLKPIYTAKDGVNALKAFIPLKYCQSIVLSQTLSVQLFDAGHILGSAFVVLNITEGESTKKIVFSGDIGTNNQPYIEDPTLLEEADLIIMETTYGNRIHENKVNRLEILAEVINSAYAKGGNIIIPAFAIERTQDILYYLQQLQIESEIPKLPVYIDSPLAVAATRIFQRNTTNFDEDSTALIENGNNPLTMENLNFSETTEESIRLNSITQGAIIISASGMADAGRIKHHLKHNLWRSNSTIVFVGYQAEGTLGRRLIDGAKEVTIHGENISVNASVVQLPGFSAHADQAELLKWVGKTGKHAKGIILVHGEENSVQDFSVLLNQNVGQKAIIPDLGECISYLDNKIIRVKPEKPWIQALEEKLAATEIKVKDENHKSLKTKYTGRKFSHSKKVLQSEVNHSYYNLKKNLKIFIDNAKKERDYSFIIETLDKISQILTESKSKHQL